MIIPNLLQKDIATSDTRKDLILEIELNGKLKFDQILYCIDQNMGICYSLLNADVEFVDGNNFGSFQLRINANSEEFQKVEFFLNENKLLNTTVEYNCRRYL